MTKHTFISYSRNDSEFASMLARELRNNGMEIWLDILDIPPGRKWDDAVQKALEECGCFLIILSPTSVESQNVKDEIGFALDEGKSIIPVLYQDCNIPLRLRRVQYIDFTDDFDSGLSQLLKVFNTMQSKNSSEQHAKTKSPLVSKSITAKRASAKKVESRKTKAASPKAKGSTLPSGKLRSKSKKLQIEQTSPHDTEEKVSWSNLSMKLQPLPQKEKLAMVLCDSALTVEKKAQLCKNIFMTEHRERYEKILETQKQENKKLLADPNISVQDKISMFSLIYSSYKSLRQSMIKQNYKEFCETIIAAVDEETRTELRIYLEIEYKSIELELDKIEGIDRETMKNPFSNYKKI